MHTETEEGRSCDKEDRDWSDVAASQVMPRTAGHHWKLEEARTSPPLELMEEAWSCDTLISDFQPLEM